MMLELFPEGFEELERRRRLELAAYTNAAGEERLWQAFGGAAASDVEAAGRTAGAQFHRPVRVGALWIGPPWETPDADALAVVIDPGRAFGTGAHPTTRLCLELLAASERGEPARRRLRLGRALDRRGELGFGRYRARRRPAGGRGDARERRRERRRRRRRARRRCATTSCPTPTLVVANIALDAVVGARRRGSRAGASITSGYLAADEPELAGYRRVERRVARRLGGRPARRAQ